MKRFLIFLLSFVILSYGFEMGSGWILTVMYTPEITYSTTLNQTVEFGPTLSPFSQLPIVLAACIAYFLSQRFYLMKKI